ncbi:MAG: flavodoxin family protein, partial [Candidatus Iainarchaeum archaeon]
CKDKAECRINDDMQKIYSELTKAKAIILITPTYFGNVSAQLKAFMDRTLMLRRNNFMLKDKIGGAIAIGRSRNGGQEYAILALRNFFLIHGMIPVGDDAHFGGILHKNASDRIGLKTVDGLLAKIRRLLH